MNILMRIEWVSEWVSHQVPFECLQKPMAWTTSCMSWRYYTPADCQEVQVKEIFTERFFTRLLLHCNWIYFNFTYTDLLFFTGHSVELKNLQNKHTMTNINYGLFLSFRNISDKNREEWDLKKHQGQNIRKGNRYHLIVGENKQRILTFSRRRQNRLNGVLGETRGPFLESPDN